MRREAAASAKVERPVRAKVHPVPRQSTAAGSVMLIGKIAAILDALAEGGEVSVARLAELVDEPRSSLYRLLQSLQKYEYVDHGVQRGTYRLGVKLLYLGGRVADQFEVRSSADPVLERLHEETGESIFLCVRDGDDAVCVERIDGNRVQSLALRVGGRLPLHAGAASRALLAFAPESDWQGYWERVGPNLARFTKQTPVTKTKLFAALTQTRERGVAISDGDVTDGIAAIGAPILDRHGEVCGALSISGIRASILGANERERSRLIEKGAAEVSRSMGFRGPDATSGR